MERYANCWQYNVEESDDYAEISKIHKVAPLVTTENFSSSHV